MAYSDIYTAATDEAHALRKQVAVALFQAAVAVVNEDPGTENHAQRLHWARGLLVANDGPVTEAAVAVWKVLENATIQANPASATDNDVQFVVNGLVDTLANR